MKRFIHLLLLSLIVFQLFGVTAYSTESEQRSGQIEEALTYEQAIESLRAQLVERRENCTVTVRADDSIDSEVLFDSALAHTGVGDEGDYLANCYLNHTTNSSVSETGERVITYTVRYRTTKAQEQLVTEVINNLIPTLRGATNIETILNIVHFMNIDKNYDRYFVNYKFLAKSTLGYDHFKQTAYGALIRNTAVCEGFAALFYRLCLECGIDSRMIHGSIFDELHAWAIADISGEGEYYVFDPTNNGYFLGWEKPETGGLQPSSQYRSEEFVTAYPVPEEPYTITIDYSFDKEAGTLTITQDHIPDIMYYDSDFGSYMNNVKRSFEWPQEVVDGTTRIVLPEGLTKVGNKAFLGFANVKYVEIPASVTSIGTSAFSGCTGLTDITIPEGVTSIGDSAFSGCTGLTDITIPEGVTSIGASAFSGCTSLTDITIPEGVTSINASVFSGCTGLTDITIPEGVTSIGDSAFSRCTGLTAITIPESVRVIGPSAFKECGLTSITLPEMLVEIGEEAFAGGDFETIILPENVQNLGTGAFRDAALVEAIIETQIKIIEPYTFYGCDNLNSVVFPASVEIIGEYAFAFCRELEQISLSDNVKVIAESAFDGCSLLDINIGEIPEIESSEWVIALNPCGGILTETEITVYRDQAVGIIPEPTRDGYTFQGWYTQKSSGNQVTADTLGHMLETDTLYAHWEYTNPSTEVTAQGMCGTLTWIIYSDGRMIVSGSGYMPSYSNNADYPWYEHRLSVKQLELKSGINSIGRAAFFGFLYLEDVILPESISGIPREAFAMCMNLKSIDVPSSIRVIGEFAFGYCKELKDVNLNCVGVLERGAFAECEAIETIKIPSTVWSMGSDVFTHCKSLKTVVIEEGATTIGRDVFRDCISLESVTLPSSVTVLHDNLFSNLPALTHVEIGAGVKVLPERLFADSANLKEITLPAGITGIEDGVFYGCTGLTDIYWNRPSENWDNVTVGSWNDILDNVTMHWGKKYVTVFLYPRNFTARVYSKLLMEGEAYGQLPTPSLGNCIFEGWYTDPVAGEKVTPEDIVIAHTLYARWSGDVASGVCQDSVTWVISNEGVLTISGDGSIPDYTSGKPAPWKQYEKYIFNIVIEEGVQEISNYAFYSLSKVKAIHIPLSVRAIGINSVSYCGKLTDVYINSSRIIWESVSVATNGNAIFGSDKVHFNEVENVVVFSGAFGTGARWSLYDSGLLKITGTGPMENFEHYTLRPWFQYSKSIYSAEVAPGIVSISDYAFALLPNLSEITLPSSLSSIGNYAFEGLKLESIIIPNGVTKLGEYVFSGCVNLKQIELPENLEEIPAGGFMGCTVLDNILIPNSVTTLGSYAFSESGITTIMIPDSVTNYGEGIFQNCVQLTEVTLPEKMDSIPYAMLSGCSSLVQIEIPQTVKAIGTVAFNECGSLNTLTLPAGLESIGYGAFINCSSLSELIIPDSVTNIGSRTFMGCTSLEKITIPSTVEKIGEYAFSSCTNLKNISLPEQLTVLETRLFNNCTALEEIIIPYEVTEIKESAFRNCTNLSQIQFQNIAPTIDATAFTNVTAVAEYPSDEASWTEDKMLNYGGSITWRSYEIEPVTSGICGDNLTWNFDENKGLLEIEGTGPMKDYYLNLVPWHRYRSQIVAVRINEGVTTISGYAFTGCKELTSIELPEGLKSIGIRGFFACEKLQTIILPDTVEAMGKSVFQNCSSLTSIVLPDGVTSIGDSAFQSCSSLTSIVLPDGVTSIGDSAFQSCSSLTSIVLPDGVTSIGDSAFQSCSSLTSIVLPDGVTSIGDSVFQSCSSLISIVVPDSVNQIGRSAFYRCRSLETVSLSINLETIPEYAFYYCDSLTDVKMPESLVLICERAFEECFNLNRVILPRNVTSIRARAFYNCGDLEVVFQGDAPEISQTAFSGSRTSAYYFEENKTWTNEQLQEYANLYGFVGWYQICSMHDWDNPPCVSRKCRKCGIYDDVILNHESDSPQCVSGRKCKYCGVLMADWVSHTWDVTSCTALKTCIFCGATEGPFLGHNWILATCTMPQTCQNCGIVEGNALEHDMGEWTTTLEPTCTAAGSKIRSCQRKDCEYEETGSIDAIGHDHQSEITDPTCTGKGYTTHTCSVCGDSYVDSYVDVLGHTEAETVVENEVAAGCETDGSYDNVVCCSVCEAELSRETMVIPATGHDWSQWEITADATCTADGVKQRTCSRCDHFETDVISAAGHTHTAVVTPPTCEEVGYTTYTCTVCGDSYIGDETSEAGHAYESVVTPPTCEEGGYTTYTCTVCGDSYIGDEISAEGHEYSSVVTEPNCTEGGYTTNICRCGETYISDEVAKLGHNFGEWIEQKKPSTSEEGFEVRTCDRCGDVETRVLEKLDNPFTDVPEGSWYYEPVMWAVQNGVTTGATETTFDPNGNCLRAHVVTFLHRAAGSPEPTSTDNPFSDVASGSFFYRPVLWAVENSITNGTGATTFGAMENCNRAAVVTFLWRAAGSPEPKSTDNPFVDVPETAFYYKAVLWAVENGITNGVDATHFGPTAACNRAQVVTFLYRAMK